MEELKLTFVNVGYGEAALLECPDPAFPGGTFVMVIDGGSAEAEEYRDSATGRIPLDQYLSLRGVDHIDLMAATHVHEDHLCGLLPAAEKLPPAALWQTLPPEFCRSMRTLDIPAEGLTPSRSKFLRALNDYRRLCLGQSCPRHRPLAGMELRLCRDLLVRVLGPSRAQAEKLASSCRALYEEADPSAFWQRLDQLDPASLRADLFKVGHHGQRDGISAEQIQAIAPRAVVCCASSDRRYNSADPAILQMMADSGARLYFSDCPPGPDGAVPPPHQALTFTVGAGGAMEGTYLSIPD